MTSQKYATLFLLLTMAASCTCATAQSPQLTPAFKEAALEEMDALNRVNSLLNEPLSSPAWADASKGLDVAHRKAETAADKNVYRLLIADYVFQSLATLGTATWESDYRNHMQCMIEAKLSLYDHLDELKPASVEQGGKHLCLNAYEETNKRLEAEAGKQH